ncbi:MAG TPA: D-alanyl-D-alanine carboxypeptidase/D-alanyl-D-alanine-endopeptidase [Gammaproteobacteria bacterium]|nr:D-alanyl-D-alanine carboxypeptidase/D-alanyl-D-alanine-endopeptidase [Gammaproteobacteria bacterium]
MCGSLAAAAHGGELPATIDRVLAGHHIGPDEVSIVVQAVDSPEPVLSYLPDAPRNPASVMKLVTTWSALELLGPTYTWPTEVYFLGDFDGRKLDGDLAIKGYGDPYLVLEDFWKLLRAVRRLGLEDIGGDLVIDDSYFDVSGEPPPGALDDQPYRTYNVVPNALLVNFKAVDFEFRADLAHGRVNVSLEPPLANLDVQNRIKLTDGPCAGYQAGISFDLEDPGLARAVLGGAFSARCGSYGLSRTVLKPDTYAYGLFETLWKETGGAFHGRLRDAVVGADATPALTWRSPPLAEVIRSINKFSNNVMTRQVLYTLAAQLRGAPGTREAGVEVVREFLSSQGLDIGPLVMENGAGLSRGDRVSARFLADLLRRAYRSPFAAEFVSSLSLAGLDGTTRRFAGLGSAGAMHIKTGTLDNVSALAGYVRGSDGEDYIVVVLLNAADAHRGPGQELQQAVLGWTGTLAQRPAIALQTSAEESATLPVAARSPSAQ